MAQYDLDYGWDINTANYVQSFDVSNQELSPNGVFFKSDGSRMYIVGSVGITGNNGDRVNEYELQTDWNISTASYVQNFDVGAQEVAPQSLAFSDDGLKMFVLGQSGDDVIEYDLDSQSPWDISTASYSQNLVISPPFSQPMGLCFSDSGRKMFITGYNADVIRRYVLSVPFDVSTAKYNHPNQFSTYLSDNTPRGVFFKPEGDKFFMVGSWENKVYSYNIPAAPLGWADIGDAVSVRSDPISVSSTEVPAGIFFHPAGTKVYVSDSSRTITEQELSTPWDISSHGNVTHTFTPPTQSGQSYAEPTDLFFKPDGTSIFYVEYQSDKVVEHTLSTAWDLSSVSSTVNATLQAPSAENRLRGLYFSPNGKKMFIIGFNDDKLRKYTLSTAWDLTSATLDTTTAAIAASPLSLWFKPDGTKLYLSDNLSDSVKQWDLDTPWDISGVTFSNRDSDHYLGNLQIDNQPRPIFISNDGRHYYVGGGQNSTFFQFSLDQS